MNFNWKDISYFVLQAVAAIFIGMLVESAWGGTRNLIDEYRFGDVSEVVDKYFHALSKGNKGDARLFWAEQARLDSDEFEEIARNFRNSSAPEDKAKIDSGDLAAIKFSVDVTDTRNKASIWKGRMVFIKEDSQWKILENALRRKR